MLTIDRPSCHAPHPEDPAGLTIVLWGVNPTESKHDLRARRQLQDVVILVWVLAAGNLRFAALELSSQRLEDGIVFLLVGLRPVNPETQ